MKGDASNSSRRASTIRGNESSQRSTPRPRTTSPSRPPVGCVANGQGYSAATFRPAEGSRGEIELRPDHRRVVGRDGGPLVVTGSAGSGRSEALARRAAALTDRGAPIDRVLVLASSRAGAAFLRGRIEALVDPAHEELAVDTYAGIAESLLLEHALEAGLDPFVVRGSAAGRLADPPPPPRAASPPRPRDPR